MRLREGGQSLPLLLIVVLGVSVGLAYYFLRPLTATYPRVQRLHAYLENPSAHPDWQIKAGERCGEAPFILPTDGYLGFDYGDSWRPGHRHQGLDIFGPTELNATPILAAYPGYLTRLPEWKSTVIIRIARDPLNISQPGATFIPGTAGASRQIWTYYTHMADPEGHSFISPDFPPGTSEQYVEAGTVLGYQGNYSGNAENPVGMHLHFSIVLDDGQGHFKNELKIENTLDPIPYLGLTQDRDGIWQCA